MLFENWNRFVQETVEELNKYKSEMSSEDNIKQAIKKAKSESNSVNKMNTDKKE